MTRTCLSEQGPERTLDRMVRGCQWDLTSRAVVAASLTMTNGWKWSRSTSHRVRGLQGCQHPQQAREGGNSFISRLMRLPLDSPMTLRRSTLKMTETEFLTSWRRVEFELIWLIIIIMSMYHFLDLKVHEQIYLIPGQSNHTYNRKISEIRDL